MTVPQQPPVTYLGGSWVALVANDVALLLDVPADSRVLFSCWAAAAGGQGLDAVLAVVDVDDFAAVARTAEGTRVVISGRGRAEINGSPMSADGGGRREERVGGRPPVQLRGGPGGAGSGRAVLPLVFGMAEASVIGVGAAAAGEQGGSAAERPADPRPVERPPADVPAAVPADVPNDPVPVPRVSNDTMPPASVYDSGLISSLPWRGTGEDSAAAFAPPPAPTPEPPRESADAAAASPFVQPTGAHPSNPWGAPEWPEPPQARPPAPPAAPVPGTPPASAPQSPWAPGASGAGTAPASQPDRSDEQVDEPGPMVHAFACPRGHLNPPYAGTCRLCGESIPPQEGFSAPRPSLGRLILSTGDTVPLDRDVVLGRAPFHADESAESRPHLVQLPSPGNDISRSHVRVNLENWFVQVTDLGSTNGTVVTLPDQAPVRLRPHDPFTILPGTGINIADEVTVRYEVS